MQKLAIVLTVFWPMVAMGTTARRASLETLSQRAEAVVVGVAFERGSRWQELRIVTGVQLMVQEVWAGAAAEGEAIEVKTLGGIANGIGQHVAGAARLPLGKRLVLFLVADGKGSFRVVGMEQGMFEVVGGPDQEPQIVRAQSTAHQVGARSAPLPKTLAAFKRAVLEARRDK